MLKNNEGRVLYFIVDYYVLNVVYDLEKFSSYMKEVVVIWLLFGFGEDVVFYW